MNSVEIYIRHLCGYLQPDPKFLYFFLHKVFSQAEPGLVGTSTGKVSDKTAVKVNNFD